MSVKVSVLPAARCLFDEPVQIKVQGLSPLQEVTLKASLIDEAGEPFCSSAHYRAEQNGELDLSSSPALGGSYSGAEPMGLFWSLAAKNPFRRLMKKNVQSPYCIDIEVYDGCSPSGKLLAKCTNERWFMKEGVTRTLVSEGRIRAVLFLPSGAGPFPGVIDLYGAAGGLVEYRASLLANHGFATLALAYFDYENFSSNLNNLDLEYFEEAVHYLQAHPKVKSHGIGVIGISKGGDLGLSMASFLLGVKAAVSISGCNANVLSFLHYRGFTIPPLGVTKEHVKLTESGALDTYAVFDDPRDPMNQDSIIPIEKAQGSFLFLAGDEDRSIPSILYVEEAIRHLQEHGRENFEYYIYPGAGHLIEPPYFPVCPAAYNKLVGAAILWGGKGKWQSAAQEDAWKKIRAFFQKHLDSGHDVRSRL